MVLTKGDRYKFTRTVEEPIWKKLRLSITGYKRPARPYKTGSTITVANKKATMTSYMSFSAENAYNRSMGAKKFLGIVVRTSTGEFPVVPVAQIERWVKGVVLVRIK